MTHVYTVTQNEDIVEEAAAALALEDIEAERIYNDFKHQSLKHREELVVRLENTNFLLEFAIVAVDSLKEAGKRIFFAKNYGSLAVKVQMPFTSIFESLCRVFHDCINDFGCRFPPILPWICAHSKLHNREQLLPSALQCCEFHNHRVKPKLQGCILGMLTNQSLLTRTQLTIDNSSSPSVKCDYYPGTLQPFPRTYDYEDKAAINAAIEALPGNSSLTCLMKHRATCTDDLYVNYTPHITDGETVCTFSTPSEFNVLLLTTGNTYTDDIWCEHVPICCGHCDTRWLSGANLLPQNQQVLQV